MIDILSKTFASNLTPENRLEVVRGQDQQLEAEDSTQTSAWPPAFSSLVAI